MSRGVGIGMSLDYCFLLLFNDPSLNCDTNKRLYYVNYFLFDSIVKFLFRGIFGGF